jgi:hypothetical protein
MEKITKSLFESILTVTHGKVEEGSVDKAHFCATHVEHSLYGQGTCISEQHAEPDEEGKVAWYTVQFPTGVLRVNTDNLKIVEGKSHAHSKKMAEEEVKDEEVVEEESHQSKTTMKHIPNASPALKKAAKDIKPGVAGYRDRVDMLKAGGVKEAKLHPNQQKLDVHEPEKDELTANDFKMLRAGKKAKMKTEASTGNAFDWKNTPSELKTKPGEKAGFDSKKIPTGTVYTRKAVKEKPVKEGITQTIINHDAFVLEVTDNPTYGDYLKALQSMINTTSEDVQQELVNVAEEAFNGKVDSIIVEAKTRATFKAKLDEIRKSGAKVLDENYSVESDESFVEYVVEKDGVLTHHVHIGKIEKK